LASRPKGTESISLAADGAPAFVHDSALFFTLFVQPEQFFTKRRGVLHCTGAYRLLIAVLQDAAECWFRYRHARRTRERRLFREIAEWFSARDRDRLFAFECICDHLELDPNYIRHGLKQWQSSHSGQPAPRFQQTPVVRNQIRLAHGESRKSTLLTQTASATMLP
jgi:hypothetical protein